MVLMTIDWAKPCIFLVEVNLENVEIMHDFIYVLYSRSLI